MLRLLVLTIGILAIAISVLLSVLGAVGAGSVAFIGPPKLASLVEGNPRRDIYVSPLIEPYTQDIGPASKHLARVSIAVRAVRPPTGTVKLALRITSTPSGQLVREATAVVWEPEPVLPDSAYPTGVSWASFDFAPVGEIANDGLTLSVIPLDGEAQHIGLAMSRPDGIGTSNIRIGASGREAPWDLTYTQSGLMSTRDHIGYLIRADALWGLGGLALGSLVSNASSCTWTWCFNKALIEWFVWFLVFGVLVAQFRGTFPVFRHAGLARWFLGAMCGVALVLGGSCLIIPLLVSDLPGIVGGGRSPLPIVGAVACLALGMRVVCIIDTGSSIGAIFRASGWAAVASEVMVVVSLGLIGVAVLLELFVPGITTEVILGVGVSGTLVAVLVRLFELSTYGVRSSATGG